MAFCGDAGRRPEHTRLVRENVTFRKPSAPLLGAWRPGGLPERRRRRGGAPSAPRPTCTSAPLTATSAGGWLFMASAVTWSAWHRLAPALGTRGTD
jgi:hypothetical protein